MVLVLLGKQLILKKNLRSLVKQLETINREDETKLNVTMIGNDKDIRNVMLAINRNLEKNKSFIAKNRFQRDEIRREVTNISHDFRTPLTSIHGFIELILEGKLSEKEKTEYLNIVLDKINVLSTITEAFYELSMFDSKEETMNLEQVNLHDTIIETLLPFYYDFDRKAINVHLDIQDKELYAFVDRSYIQRIIINLVQNVLRYAKETFELTVSKETDTIKIIATNDHEGMEDLHIPSLFHRTYTTSSSRSNKQLGLGLYIVKELVEKQQGTIEISNNNQLFEVRITFPR